MITRRISRRTFAKAGAGAAALALARRGAGQESITPYVLLVYASGGWDQTMVFDAKLDSGYVTQEPGAVAAAGAGNLKFVDHPSRPQVKAWFDAYGANGAVVNGLSCGSMDRKNALLNTWGMVPSGKSRPVDWLSYYSNALNPIFDLPHAVIDAPYMPGDYTGIAVRLTKQTILELTTAPDAAQALGTDGEAALLNFRKSAYGDFFKAAHANSLDGEKLRALYYGFARDGLIKTRLASALQTLGPQDAAESDFERHGKLAVELFASGGSLCATVQAGRTGLWDTATDHFNRQTANYELLFGGLNKIFAYATQRGILNRMLVVVVSDTGRAPRVNAQGGKAPWAFTSALLWGVGVNGGVTAGVTDAALRGLPIDPLFGTQDGQGAVTLEMGHVWAALYTRFGIPVKAILPSHKPLSQILMAEAQ